MKDERPNYAMVDVLFDIFGFYRIDPPVINNEIEVQEHAIQDDE